VKGWGKWLILVGDGDEMEVEIVRMWRVVFGNGQG
jgi:hypothetical protein